MMLLNVATKTYSSRRTRYNYVEPQKHTVLREILSIGKLCDEHSKVNIILVLRELKYVAVQLQPFKKTSTPIWRS